MAMARTVDYTVDMDEKTLGQSRALLESILTLEENPSDVARKNPDVLHILSNTQQFVYLAQSIARGYFKWPETDDPHKLARIERIKKTFQEADVRADVIEEWEREFRSGAQRPSKFNYTGHVARAAELMKRIKMPSPDDQFWIDLIEACGHSCKRVDEEHAKEPEPFRLSTLRSTHREITFKELHLRLISRGCFVLCRNLCAPYGKAYQGLHAQVVEDTNGQKMHVALNYFVAPHLPFLEDLSWALPPGDMFVIVEPFFYGEEDGRLTVRVDNPTLVVLLDDDDPFVRGVTWKSDGKLEAGVRSGEGTAACRQRGNELFRRGEWSAAAKAYTQGLLECRPDNPADRLALLSNRSEALLKLRHYRLALRDARRALKIQPSHCKSQYRRIRARIGLRQFREALLDVEDALLYSPDNELFLESKLQLGRRTTVLDKPTYNATEMLAFTKRYSDPADQSLMYADFVGPVEVKLSPGRGRGLFATRNISAGSLFLAEKAYGVFYENTPPGVEAVKWLSERTNTKPPKKKEHVHNEDHECGGRPELCQWKTTRGYHDHLLWHLLQLVSVNAGVARAIQSMVATVELPEDKVEDLCAFPCESADEGEASMIPVGLDHLEKVIFFCGLPFNDIQQERHDNGGGEMRTAIQWVNGKALYRVGSLINHQCGPANCAKFHIGDFVFVCAYHDIKKGDELTVSYSPANVPLSGRQSFFENYFGFQCNCTQCRTELALGQQYQHIMKEIERYGAEMSNDQPAFKRRRAEMASLVSRVEAKLPAPSHALFYAHFLRAVAVYENGDILMAGNALVKSVSSMAPRRKPNRYSFSPDTALIAFWASRWLMEGMRPERSKEWYQRACDIALRRFGRLWPLVHFVYPGHIDSLSTLLDQANMLKVMVKKEAALMRDERKKAGKR